MSKVQVKDEEPGDFKQTNIIKVVLNEEDFGTTIRFNIHLISFVAAIHEITKAEVS